MRRPRRSSLRRPRRNWVPTESRSSHPRGRPRKHQRKHQRQLRRLPRIRHRLPPHHRHPRGLLHHLRRGPRRQHHRRLPRHHRMPRRLRQLRLPTRPRLLRRRPQRRLLLQSPRPDPPCSRSGKRKWSGRKWLRRSGPRQAVQFQLLPHRRRTPVRQRLRQCLRRRRPLNGPPRQHPCRTLRRPLQRRMPLRQHREDRPRCRREAPQRRAVRHRQP
jgi:hypothetical protein